MTVQRLWIANSSLVIMFILMWSFQWFLQEELPVLRVRRKNTPFTEETQAALVVNLEKIYKNDIFDTYKEQAKPGPQRRNLSTPVPKLKLAPQAAPPPIKKASFVPPLTITLRGIILSTDEEKSIAMIADNTGKDRMYHLGDRIEDGQIIKITQNKVVILRSNGQQETFYLRKPEKLTGYGSDSWGSIIKKVSPELYHINPLTIGTEISSVGELIELLHLGTAYQDGKPIGIRVGLVDKNNIGSQFGLQVGDVITTVNNISATEPKERIKIYDTIKAAQIGDNITVSVLRNEKPFELSYALKKIASQKNNQFAPQKEAAKKEDSANTLFKLGKSAERKMIKTAFDHKHHTIKQQQKVVGELRKRLLEKMKKRANSRRIR